MYRLFVLPTCTSMAEPRWILPTTPYITFQSHVAYNLLFCIIAKPVLLLISGRVRGPALLTATITVLQWSCYSEGQSGSILGRSSCMHYIIVRRVPFWMLAVYCVDGLNVYYQMLQHIAQCVRNFSIRYIRYTRTLQWQCWSFTVSLFSWVHNGLRQIKKEHLNQVAHWLSEYLERLLRSTDYETNLNLQYHDELCINVSRINRCSMNSLIL